MAERRQHIQLFNADRYRHTQSTIKKFNHQLSRQASPPDTKHRILAERLAIP